MPDKICFLQRKSKETGKHKFPVSLFFLLKEGNQRESLATGYMKKQ